MRILLAGRRGQVGVELEPLLGRRGELTALDRDALDLSDAMAIRRVVRELQPGLIVNAAAYTAVDRAESEPEPAARVNAAAPAVLAEEAKRAGALLVHYSTDYVFDGRQRTPYREDDATNPLSVYGRTKLEGEKAVRASGARHLIVRTAWVYGEGRNFVNAILAKAAAGEALRVVDDQRGAPTWARDIAAKTVDLLEKKQESLFHVTAEGEASWHEVAREILKLKGLDVPLAAIPTREWPTPARRPAYSVLDNSRLQAAGIPRIGPWRERLAAALAKAK
jgi:dTDP-4-dehydrorhamnose reductase